ncbi:MAG: PEP-CTERM sorting domain-containing protein [Acidobacteria bacterium]|nr:PEP-CTERM sorting domain-containing protein [Acidobacteriota bacterium]
MKAIRILLWMTLVMLAAVIAPATTITDPYVPNPGSASNNGDVIGLLYRFDIESVAINYAGGNLGIQVRMNYGQNGGDTTLSAITVGGFPNMYPGDLLFQNGGSRWAVPLISHNNSSPGLGALLAGHLYSVSSFLTASTVLNNPNGTYRPNEDVWGNSTGASDIGGAGTVQTSLIGSGPEILVNITIPTQNALFLSALSSSWTLVNFASATCGNDVLEGGLGDDRPIPEPVTLSLTGAGLVLLGFAGRRRLAKR